MKYTWEIERDLKEGQGDLISKQTGQPIAIFMFFASAFPAVLVLAVIPFGDMSIILGSGGSKSKAFSIHAVTCAVLLVVGLLLIHAI